MPYDFFSQRKRAAEIKHRILEGYLGIFTGKVGSTSTAGRVGYIDGFAGPGVYDDGAPGSPLIAANIADLLGRRRNLVGYFVEEDSDQAEQLQENLTKAGHSGWRVWNEQVEDALPAILEAVGDEPLLIFLDPYGLAVPFDLLVERVMKRPQKTEVLLHFTRSGLDRLAGHLEPQWWIDAEQNREAVLAERGEEGLVKLEKQRLAIIRRLDRFLGGSWWQDIRRAAEPEWREQVRNRFIDMVRNSAGGGWGSFVTPVPQRFDGPPVYELVLFTRNDHGIWAFNDATARAFRWLHEQNWREEGSQGSLFAEGEGGYPDPRPEYIRQIKTNVVEALRGGRDGFMVVKNIPLILAGTVGRAGSSEVRVALQQLHDEGILGGDRPKSKQLEYYVITRGPNAPT